MQAQALHREVRTGLATPRQEHARQHTRNTVGKGEGRDTAKDGDSREHPTARPPPPEQEGCQRCFGFKTHNPHSSG